MPLYRHDRFCYSQRLNFLSSRHREKKLDRIKVPHRYRRQVYLSRRLQAQQARQAPRGLHLLQ